MQTFRPIVRLLTVITALLIERRSVVDAQVNLALKKAAYQISTFQTYLASYAVDGNSYGVLGSRSCSHTDGTLPNPWWAVDLGQNYSVVGITIVSRSDWSADTRLDYFVVGLTNSQPTPGQPIPLYNNYSVYNNYTLCGQYPRKVAPGTTVQQSCPLDLLQYRYVIIQTNSNLTGQQFLDMCEVMVYGYPCDPHCLVGCGLYGSLTCNGNCSDGYGPTTTHTCIGCDVNCLNGCNDKGGGKCDGLCNYSYAINKTNDTCAPCDRNCDDYSKCAEPEMCVGPCQPGYTNVNYKCKPCDINCAVGCTSAGPDMCDGPCRFGYTNVNYKCKRCDVNCATGCDISGAGHCDGPCYCGFYLTQFKNCTKRVNLALNKTASVVQGGSADLAVDGKSDSCSLTTNNFTNPWWAVDLGEEYSIVCVNITGSKVNANFIVGLTNSKPQQGQPVTFSTYTQCGQYSGTMGNEAVNQSCPLDLPSYRFVIIQTNSTPNGLQNLNLCEVEVYGFNCDPNCVSGCGLYGPSTCNGICNNSFGPIVSTHKCQACDPNCSPVGCNDAGGGFCDGPCLNSFYLTADKRCQLIKLNASTVSAISPTSTPGPAVGAIVGGVVGGVLGAALIAGLVLLVVCLMRRRKRDPEPKEPITEQIELEKPSHHKNSKKLQSIMGGTTVLLTDLADYIELLKATNGYKTQFDELPKDDINLCVVGKLPENKKKNRFVNILPYEETRVKIFVKEDDESEETYINGSFITEYKGSNVAYIATQAPKSETVDVFWEMIWQQNVTCIVALVLTYEDGKNRCHTYWPESVDGTVTSGRFTIKLVQIEAFSEFIKRKLSFHTAGKPPRTLTQFQYLVWPDKGVPEHIWSLTDFRNRVRSFMPKSSAGKDRMVVHCSAGVGRTGTFMALDILLDEAAANGRVDVFDVVKHLRQQRMSCVQTKDQYELLYLAVLDAYVTGNTVHSQNELKSILSSLQKTGTHKAFKTDYQKLMELKPVIPPDDELEALKPINVKKNRRKDVIPLSYSSRCLLPIGSDGSDYINASKAKGYKMPHTYILTQLPLSNTIDDFWKMVVVENCTSAVLLQSVPANDPPFYPTKLNQANDYGDTKVILKSMKSVEARTCSIVLHTMAVSGKIAGENVELELRLHELSSWNKLNVPQDYGDILELINLVNKWERRQQGKLTSEPDGTRGSCIIVQCLDGATRSALYAATSLAIDRLKCNNELDVFLSCRYITSVRPHTIISQAQYDFVCRAALESLTWKPSITGDAEMLVSEQTSTTTSAATGDHVYGNINHAGPSTDGGGEGPIYTNTAAFSQEPSLVVSDPSNVAIYENYNSARV